MGLVGLVDRVEENAHRAGRVAPGSAARRRRESRDVGAIRTFFLF